MLSFSDLMAGALRGVLPVVLLVGFGVLIPAVRLLKASAFSYFSTMVFKYTFPISLIYMLGANITIVYEDLLIISAYLVMIGSLFLVSMLCALFLNSREDFIAGTVHMWCGSTLSNCVVVGAPMIAGLFGDQYSRYCFIHIYPWGMCLVFYYFMYEFWTASKQRKEIQKSSSIQLEEVPSTSNIHADLYENNHNIASENTEVRGVEMNLEREQAVQPDMARPTSIPMPSTAEKSLKINYGRLICISIRNTFKVPIIICLLISIIYLIIGIYFPQIKSLPIPLKLFFVHMGNTVTPVANLMMGMYTYMRVEECIKRYRTDKQEGNLRGYKKYMWMETLRFCIMTFLRQFLGPLIMMGVMFAMKLDITVITMNTILAATPTGVFAFVMCDTYGYCSLSTSAAAIIQCVTMFLAVPTLYYICMAVGG